MRLRGDIQPVTSLKSEAAQLLRFVNETRHPVVITQSGEPKAVLIDFETYDKLRAATLLLKLIAQGEADVRARRRISQDKVFRTARDSPFGELGSRSTEFGD
jgi:prevent-host-death family protein